MRTVRLFLPIFCVVFMTGSSRAQQVPVSTPQAPAAASPDHKWVHAPVPLVTPIAEFPEEARRRRLNGICLVSTTVDTNGMPQEIKVVRCTDSIFVSKSVDAVKKYRFKPAIDANGQPVEATIRVAVHFMVIGGHGADVQVSYAVRTPPGVISAEPDSSGVYPLIGSVAAPELIKFIDDGYGMAAFWAPANGSCDVVLEVDASGKASNAEITQCERPILEKAAMRSLLESHYKAGRMNGTPVPVRVSIHLEFGGFSNP